MPLTGAHSVLSYPLLQLESRTGDWGRWLAHHGHPGLRPPAMLFDQFATMTQAAIHGMGLALLPTFLIDRDWRPAGWCRSAAPPCPRRAAYYLVWPEARAQRAPLASFRAFLAEEVGVIG
jgi:LysR family glycine cleavage system transcriptional activator